MFSQVRQALDSLAAALDCVEGAPTADLREALALAKPLRARLETLETAVASQIAKRERHGDGGAGVLHQIAAVPRSDAARNVRTTAELEQLPTAQSALADGEMCMANAARLARAARRTSAEAVQGDADLMNLAKTLPPDEFAQASARWAAKHESAASLADRRLQRDGPADNSAVRTRDQRMADALDGILTHSGSAPTAADEPPQGGTAAGNETTGCGHAAGDSTGSAGHKAQTTQIIVRADLADLLDDHGGIGEIAGTGPVPASVIDRLCCNADISVVLFGKELTPLYEAVAARAPTAAQRRALIARDGACIGCGAPPGDCEAHHIIPWLCGGPTKIDNLVLVCWSCHDKIHDHNWQVIKRNNRYRLIPPDAESAPNPARSKKPTPRRNPAPLQDAAPTHTLDLSREPALFP